MCDYILNIRDIGALYRYIMFLTDYEFAGDIFLGQERIDAKDILRICDNLKNELRLRIRRGNKTEIEKYLCENGLLERKAECTSDVI